MSELERAFGELIQPMVASAWSGLAEQVVELRRSISVIEERLAALPTREELQALSQEIEALRSRLRQDSGEPDLGAALRQMVRNSIQGEFASHLHDIQYELSKLRDLAEGNARAHAEDLNLAAHLLEGYTFTNNSPTAGSVAWAGLHVVYKGSDYTVTDGNTANKYLYWQLASPTTMQTSNTKPTLGIDDVLIGLNIGGTFQLMMEPGKLPHGSMIQDASISGAEVAAAAIGTTHLVDGSVATAKLADGAVTTVKVTDNAITTAKIGDSQVTGAKIANFAVSSSKTNLATHLIY